MLDMGWLQLIDRSLRGGSVEGGVIVGTHGIKKTEQLRVSKKKALYGMRRWIKKRRFKKK